MDARPRSPPARRIQAEEMVLPCQKSSKKASMEAIDSHFAFGFPSFRVGFIYFWRLAHCREPQRHLLKAEDRLGVRDSRRTLAPKQRNRSKEANCDSFLDLKAAQSCL